MRRKLVQEAEARGCAKVNCEGPWQWSRHPWSSREEGNSCVPLIDSLVSLEIFSLQMRGELHENFHFGKIKFVF